MMMHNTNVKFPKAPTVRPIIDINKFSVGHDFANLNTRSYKSKNKNTDAGRRRGRNIILKGNKTKEKKKESEFSWEGLDRNALLPRNVFLHCCSTNLRKKIGERNDTKNRAQQKPQKNFGICSSSNQILLTKRNERNTDNPWTPSKPSSTSDSATIIKSNIFQPTWK